MEVIMPMIYAILGCGGLAAIAMFIPRIIGGFKGKQIKKIIDGLPNKQEIIEENIKVNYQNSIKLETKIKTNNKLDIEKKQEIKKITDKASEKINIILNTEKLYDIQEVIDNNWDDI